MSQLLQNLTTLSTAYAGHRRISIPRLSTIVLNNGQKLSRIFEDTSDLTTKSYEAAMAWFSTHWPADLDWPEDVPRPVPARRPAMADDGGQAARLEP